MTVKDVTDPKGLNLITTRQFITDPKSKAFGKLIAQDNPDGSWLRKKYDPKTGRLLASIHPFADSTPDQPETAHRVTKYEYTPVGKEKNDLFIKVPTITREFIAGKEQNIRYVQRTKNKDGVYKIVTERALPEAKFGDPKNIRSSSTFYSSDPKKCPTPASRSLLHIVTRDGAPQTTYTYQNVTYTPPKLDTEPATWKPDPKGDHILVIATEGTAKKPNGIPNKTTRQLRIDNSAHIEVYSETQVCAAADTFETISWQATELDSFKKPYRITDPYGLVSEKVYTCCGGLVYTIDSSGARTDYDIDPYARVLARTRDGITTKFTLNGFGEAITETRSAGKLSLTKKQEFDQTGDLVKSISEDGLTTSYKRDIPKRISTTILPGGATQITTSYRDGRTKSNTGTAVIASYHNETVEIGKRISTTIQAKPDSPRRTIRISDGLGRSIESKTPAFGKPNSFNSSISEYDNTGRTHKSFIRYADGTTSPASLVAYNELGRAHKRGHRPKRRRQSRPKMAKPSAKVINFIAKIPNKTPGIARQSKRRPR